MSIKRFFPDTRPTLDLNFAASKRLDPRITFTRTSTGTFMGANGLIQSAAANQARFDHKPVTGESLGLLIEEARTNVWTRSEEFNDAAWTKTNAAVTSNAAIAPDGSLTADKLIANATTSQHFIERSKTIAYPAWSSFYLKAAEYTICDVYDVNVNHGFRIDLVTGTISASPSFNFNANYHGVDVIGNGWYRVRIGRSDVEGTLNNPVRLYPNGAPNYLGDDTSGILVWGAQLEAGFFPTSYIPTAGASVTRAADVASITGANFSSWYNSSEGTLMSQFRILGRGNIGASSNYNGLWSFTPNTSSTFQGFVLSGTSYYVETNNGPYLSGGGVVNNQLYKGVAALKSGLYAIAGNGSTPSTSTTTVPSLSVTGIDIGAAFAGGTNYLNGHCSRLTYWPIRLPNINLQGVTQ